MRRTLIAILACVLLATAPIASARVASSDEQLTRQAIQLYAQKQAQQAIALEMQAVKTKPGKWLHHAVLSYFLWQESKPKEAIIEGNFAIRHAPRNPVLLINEGIMLQASGDLESAVSCFAKARALAPSAWKAWIGEAQSLTLAGRAEEAASILGAMASRSSNDFNWYYELGQAYLSMDRPDLAAGVAPKSVKLATPAEQKSNSLIQLFLAYLRDNQIERANELKHQVFCDNKSIDAQIYLGSASALVPVLEPGAATEILNSAVANLEEISDSETFFRLAKIFEEKANYVSYDSTKCSAWLQNEELAYRQAIKLNPRPPIYRPNTLKNRSRSK
jgi:tetratricopeptide (TPR) repeat protein